METRNSWNVAEVTLPASTVLKVKRVYIRNGKGFEDYDSLTFSFNGKKLFPDGTFWLKLEAVNRLEIKTPSDIKDTQEERKKTSLDNQMKACQKVLTTLDSIQSSALLKGLNYKDYARSKDYNVSMWSYWYNSKYESYLVLVKRFNSFVKSLKNNEISQAEVKNFEKELKSYQEWINEQKGKSQ